MPVQIYLAWQTAMMSLIYGTVSKPGENAAGLCGRVGLGWLTFWWQPGAPVTEKRPFGHLNMLGDGLVKTAVGTCLIYLWNVSSLPYQLFFVNEEPSSVYPTLWHVPLVPCDNFSNKLEI